MLTSTNGEIWTARPATNRFSADRLSQIAYGNGLFMAITVASGVSVSTNGIDWSPILLHGGAVVDLNGLVYGTGTFDLLYGDGLYMDFSRSYLLEANVEGDGLGLTVTGGGQGQVCRLRAANSLETTNWVDVLTFTNLPPTTHLEDSGATNYSRRFYRVAFP